MGPKALKQLRSFKDHPISRVYFELFKDFYPTYDVFQPNIEISVLNEDPVTKRAVFRFKNSVFLEDSEDYIYHIYLALGITEGVLSRQLETEVKCNVEKIYVSKNKGASYFDVSIQIKDKS